jgi:hypothetical protein
MTTKPIPDIGQKWRSAEGVVGEVIGFFDDYTPRNKLESVKNEHDQLVYENYFVLLDVPGATGPIEIQENTFLAGWDHLSGPKGD